MHPEERKCRRKNDPNQGCQRGTGISNLLFTNDSLLFFKATREEARVVDSILNMFQRCMGQLLSPSKCSVLFSSAFPMAIQSDIKAILKVTSSTFEEKYLGLPTPDGRMKNGCF
jgi:hypothetical protein